MKLTSTVRVAVAATAIAAVALVAPSAAAAEDFGNWSAGCAGGWACFWRDAVGSGPASAAYTKDSYFPNNNSSGATYQMNDNVKFLQNRMTTLGARGYGAMDYGGVIYSCIPKRNPSGTYNVNQVAYLTNDNGMSSWKSC